MYFWFLFLPALFFALSIVIPAKRRRSFSLWKVFNPPKGDSIPLEDSKKLAAAEEELKSIPLNAFVHVKTYDSAKGYSEPYMIDLVGFFWEQDISATFDTQASYGGTMRSYVLKCLPEDLIRIKELLPKAETLSHSKPTS